MQKKMNSPQPLEPRQNWGSRGPLIFTAIFLPGMIGSMLKAMFNGQRRNEQKRNGDINP